MFFYLLCTFPAVGSQTVVEEHREGEAFLQVQVPGGLFSRG